MSQRLHHGHQGFHHFRRNVAGHAPLKKTEKLARIVEQPLAGIGSLLKRASDSSNECSDGSKGKCQKPTDSNNVTLPVALAVVIPILLAIIIFIYLHRKHVKKLRLEDANDPHKSLDFGWDPVVPKGRNKSKKRQPEMTITDLNAEKSKRPRGMSMDIDIGSPYLLPPALSGSRESLHSMSRTIHTQDDRYRPATVYTPGETRSLYSSKANRKAMDDSSSASGSTKPTARDDMRQDLLSNAQRMSKSVPPAGRSPIPEISSPEAAKEAPQKAWSPNLQSDTLSPNFPLVDSPRDSYMDRNGFDLRKSNNYLAGLINSRPQSSDLLSQPSQYSTPNEKSSTAAPTPLADFSHNSPLPIVDSTHQHGINVPQVARAANTSEPLPPRKQSLRASETANYEYYFGRTNQNDESFKVTPPSPHDSLSGEYRPQHTSSHGYLPSSDEYSLRADVHESLGYDVQRLSMGVRPLPPEDPSDNPEQRANRIRSFYKEYFDDSKAGPLQTGDYFEDYDQDYLGDGAIYDPASGQFVTSNQSYYPDERGRNYPQPYGRRAMTPPPRVPPRYSRRHAATMSGSSRPLPPGPRAFSSASGRFGPPDRRYPKKKLVPPKALNVLPTPHMLKDDSFAILSSMDFAPPASAKDRAAGRPESPRGGLRPYSPAVSAHMPLQSSYDELASMPSPHLLRKSGTFTALDFAPPPRFKDRDGTASDAGSIRSNRSGLSATAAYNVRAGAYRVSRIPKEVVGTKDEINESLRPNWDLKR